VSRRIGWVKLLYLLREAVMQTTLYSGYLTFNRRIAFIFISQLSILRSAAFVLLPDAAQMLKYGPC